MKKHIAFSSKHNDICIYFSTHKALFHKVRSSDPKPFTAGVTFSRYLFHSSRKSAQILVFIIKLLRRHIDPCTDDDWNKSFNCHLSLLALPFGLIWNDNTIISNTCLFERRKLSVTASVLNCNTISSSTFYIEISKIHTEGGLFLKNVLQGEPRRLFCLQLLVFSQGIDFVLSYTWYYEWRGYLFTSPNQAWLGRTISAVMKSIFQARSTMVTSPTPRPLIKETFPPFWGVC